MKLKINFNKDLLLRLETSPMVEKRAPIHDAPRMRRVIGAAAVLAIGGGIFYVRSLIPEKPEPLPAVAGLKFVLGDLPGRGTTGLSGLARASNDRYFAVPERASFMLPFTGSATASARVEEAILLEDVPRGVELEGLAFIDEKRFAIATEHQEARDDDLVLIGELFEKKARIVDQIKVEYRAWKIEAEANGGMEGICFASGKLIAGIETVIEEDGARYAPIAIIDLATRAIDPRRVKLTTETGKIAGLECRALRDRIEIFAIERHYGVSRVLRFFSSDFDAKVVIDLGALTGDPIPNFEGLALTANDALLFVADNSPPGIQPPALLFARAPVIAPNALDR